MSIWQDWNDSDGEGNVTVPEGVYVSRITGHKFKFSEKAGKEYLIIEIKVVHGDYEGESVDIFKSFDSKQSVGFLKKEIKYAGGNIEDIKVNSLDEFKKVIGERLDALNGELVTVEVNAKGFKTITGKATQEDLVGGVKKEEEIPY